MTVSGAANFNPTVTQLITQVYRDMDVIDPDEAPTGSQFTEALFVLNSIVKGMEATGIHVWTEEEAIVFLVPGQARYLLGAAAGSAQAPAADAWIQAALSASYAAGATVLNLVSTAGIAAGDDIGVVLDSGVTYWTTVNGAPAGGHVTLTAGLPSSASSGNVVVDFAPAAQIVRPLKVPRARLFTFVSQTEIPMTVLSRQEYMDLPNKVSPGPPAQFFYSPRRDQGQLYIWPVPVICAWAVRITWYRPLQDFLAPGDTMDFPQEWAAPLRWLLADELKLGYSIPPARAQMITAKAAEWTVTVSGWDRESEPVQFGMDYTQTGRR